MTLWKRSFPKLPSSLCPQSPSLVISTERRRTDNPMPRSSQANIRTESSMASATTCLKKLRMPLPKLSSKSTGTPYERMNTEVLIVGAGPTGLVLALWLARLGTRVRIIDKTAEPGNTSRALAVQARTLELYRQLGLADAVVEAGLVFSAANLWARSTRAAHVELGTLGVGRSPYPFGLIYPQDGHERFLIERLEELNVRVERGTELIDFEEPGGGVVAHLRGSTCEAAFLAGCDGAHSTVREKLGIGYPGGTYEHLFYVADVEASGPLMDGELHVSLDESDFAAVFPLKSRDRVRLIGTIRPGAEKRGQDYDWDDVSK